MKTGILALMISAAVPALATAADMALVISNGNYDALRDDRGVTRAHAATVRSLSDQGYQIIDGTDLDRLEIRQLIERVDSVVGELQGVVVLCAGQFVNDGVRTWFLPKEYKGRSAVDVAFDGIQVDLLLQLAARHQGRAVVALAASNPDDDWEDGLQGGIAVKDVPHGVLLLSGPEDEITPQIRRMADTQGSIAATLEDIDSDITVQGFVSPDWGVNPPAADTGAPGDLMDLIAEQAMWVTAESGGSRADYESFLRRYPNGAFAELARARLRALAEADEPEPTPPPSTGPTPAQIEAGLRLTRNQRAGIQTDLTLLGHDTRGVDGIFGRGSRSAISDWQRENGFEATGYLTADQVSLLNRQADRRREETRDQDDRYWQLTGARGTKADLQLYLDRYPDGLHSEDARRQLAALEREENRAADEAAWETARAVNTANAYRDYLERFPDGLFADAARARIAALEPDGLGDREQALARAVEDRMNLNLGSRLAIETSLVSRGFRPGPVDGVFDSNTRRAIRDFQRSKGMEATGYMNPATFRALLFG